MVKKISIIGSGSVGSTLAFHLLSRVSLQELVLVDISGDLAKGVALDLEDTRGFLKFPTNVKGTKNFSHIQDSDIVVMTAGVARKDGMTRQDLLQINAKVAKEVAAKIKKFSPTSVVIVVTNPLDFITYVVANEVGFDRTRVLGMGTSLDTSRLMNILHNQVHVSVESLQGYVFGSHSKDMIASADRITVGGQPLQKFAKPEIIEKMLSRVQLRGAEIVGHLKNRSAHFAPSLACCHLVEAIANNTNEIIPVSVLLKGEYSVKNMCMGVPCIINRRGIDTIIQLEVTEQEQKAINELQEMFKQNREILVG